MRARNGDQKLLEETDLIQIVKTLRQARFIIDQTLDSRQQKLVDYFNQYSLETSTVRAKTHNKDHPKLSLINSLNEPSDINKEIISKLMQGRPV